MQALEQITNSGKSLEEIEGAMLEGTQVECPITHHFGPDIYIREALMPAGTMVMGHAHRKPSMNVMVAGKMAVLIDGVAQIMEAPMIFTAPAGRKLAYIIEDVVIHNVYATSETDVHKLEDQIVDKSATWQDHKLQADAALLLIAAEEET
mgnify:FL=1|tara:strand:+ start:3672 stop:4121 length:450 start_codon:yes stop_codon:yes gene_type:complete